jgi:hypothetical protein
MNTGEDASQNAKCKLQNGGGGEEKATAKAAKNAKGRTGSRRSEM